MSQAYETDDLFSQRRFGRFNITEEQVRRCSEAVRLVMAACIITRCERRFPIAAFLYEGMSPYFDPVPDGDDLPSYEWIVSYDDETGCADVAGTARRVDTPAVVRRAPRKTKRQFCP